MYTFTSLSVNSECNFSKSGCIYANSYSNCVFSCVVLDIVVLAASISSLRSVCSYSYCYFKFSISASFILIV